MTHKILVELEPEVETAIREEAEEKQMSVSELTSWVVNTIVKACIKAEQK